MTGLGCVPLLGAGQEAASNASSPLVLAGQLDRRAITRDIEREISLGRLTGISLALVARGRLVWAEGFGWADQEARRPATSSTPFAIASTTKTFTTAAMMAMVEDGGLDLDASANAYLAPDNVFDDAGPADGVTLRRLASHTAGLPTFFLMYPDDEPVSRPSFSALLRDYGHLVALPGEHYEYSNLGMTVVAEIVARRSSRVFSSYVNDRLLRPLGMRDSVFAPDAARRTDMAASYADDGARLPFYVTATPGSGEMFASARDLAIWATFHLKTSAAAGRVLRDSSLELLHRPVTRADDVTSYGLGWMVCRSSDGWTVLHHGGGQTGVKAEFVLLPEFGVAAIVLSNRRTNQAFVQSLRDRLIRSVLAGWQGLPMGKSTKGPLDSAYVGKWQGSLLAQGRWLPAQLRVADDHTAILAIGNAAPTQVTEVEISDGRLSGASQAIIEAGDARREGLREIALNLRLRGDALDGEVIAWSKTGRRMAILPYWIRLSRERSNERRS